MNARASLYLLCVSVVVITRAADARAESASTSTHTPVIVTIATSCEAIDSARVRRAMAIELAVPVTLEAPHDPVDGQAPAPNTNATKVAIACTSGWLLVEVDDPLTAKRLARTMPWHGAEIETRSRLLALGASELVIASWAELAVEPRAGAAAAPTPNATPITPEQAATRQLIAPRLEHRVDPNAPRLRLSALLLAQTFFSGVRTLGGGSIELGRDEAHQLGWIVDVAETHGNVHSDSGPIAIDLLSLGAACWFHRNWQRVTLRGGFGFRTGAVRFAGTASDPRTTIAHTLWGPWLGVTLAASVEVALTRRVALRAGVDVGYVALRFAARAFDHDLVAIDGASITANVGVTIFP